MDGKTWAYFGRSEGTGRQIYSSQNGCNASKDLDSWSFKFSNFGWGKKKEFWNSFLISNHFSVLKDLELWNL